MSQWVYFAIHHGDNERGVLKYNKETKEFGVELADPAWAKKVEDYVTAPQTVKDAVSLNEYEEKVIDPLSSYENLKLTLTRMWVANGVQVDWGIPVEVDGVLHFVD